MLKVFNRSNIGKRKELVANLPRRRKLVSIASNKGGQAKSTTAVNVAASLHELGFSVALVEGNIDGPNVGNYMSGALNGYDSTAFVDFFKTPVEEGKESELLSKSLYELPDHPGFSVSAISEQDQSLKIILNRYTLPEHYNKLAEGVRGLDFDYTVVDLGTGKGKDQVLRFWNQSDVRVVSFTPSLEAVIDAANLVEASQLDYVVEYVIGKRSADYVKYEEVLEQNLIGYRVPIERLEGDLAKADSNIGYVEERIEKAEAQLNGINQSITSLNEKAKARRKSAKKTNNADLNSTKRELRTQIKGLNQEIESSKEELETLRSDRVGTYENLAGFKREYEGVNQSLSDLREKRDHEYDQMRNVRSLLELKNVMNSFEGGNEMDSQGFIEKINFNFSPTFFLPNMVSYSNRSVALNSFDVIEGEIEKAGFSTDNLLSVRSYIPRVGYVDKSKDDGFPLIYHPSFSTSTVAGRYRDLAWEIVQKTNGE